MVRRRRKNPRERKFYSVTARVGTRSLVDYVPASDLQQAVRVAMSRWRHAGYSPNESAVRGRRTNPRTRKYVRSSASVIAKRPTVYALIARPKSRKGAVLVYAGNKKFSRRVKDAVFFTSKDAATIVARFMRMQFKPLQQYNFYARDF
jgi:hypothetical protein